VVSGILSRTESVKDHPADANLRVLGPPGSGKTTCLIERYRALTAEHPDSVFVVTYSGASLRRLTERLVASGEARVGAAPAMTFFSLARDVIAGSGGKPQTVIDGVRENLVLEQVIESSVTRFRSDYLNIRTSDGLRRELLDVFHLLMQSGLTEAGDRKRLMDSTRDAAVSDVFMLYDGFIGALEKRDLATFYDIAWRAARVAQTSNFQHPLESARVLLVDDFQDIDEGQFELLRAVAPPEGDRALSVFGDPMGSLFGFRGTQSRFLLDEFPQTWSAETVRLKSPGQGAPSIDRALDAILGETLGEHASSYSTESPRSTGTGEGQLSLFDQPGETVAEEPEGRFDITVTDDEMAEAYSVAASVDGLLREGRGANEIAIVSNRKDEYEPLIATAFHQWGIPLDAGRRSGDAFREFVYAVLAMFGGQQGDIIERRILTSPFFDAFREVNLKPTVDPARNFAKAAKSLGEWTQKHKANLRSEPEEKHVPYLIREVLTAVCERHAKEAGDGSVHGVVSQLDMAWRDFLDALETTGNIRKPGIAAFLRNTDLFERVTGVPSSSEHVGLYSCRELKGLYFPVIFVVGCSELLFPSARSQSAMLPLESIQDTLRDSFTRGIEVYGARKPDALLREGYHLLYSSLARSAAALHVSAPEQFGGQQYPAPTSILKNVNDSDPLQCDEAAVMPPSARFARGWVRSTGDETISAALEALNPTGPAWLLGEPEKKTLSLTPFPLSKTSIETWVRCPRQFFYRRVLKVKEDESIYMHVGSLFHEVMRDLGERFPTKDELHAGATDDVVDEAAAAAIEKEYRIEQGTFIARSLEHHIASMVRSLLLLDRKVADAYETPGVEAALDFESGGWKFNGKIDRVEQTPGGEIIITDYKTGELKKQGKTIRGRVLATLTDDEKEDWQVPVYLSGYQDGGKRATAFKHYAVQPGEDPFYIKLFVVNSVNDLPEEFDTEGKSKNKRHSYILASELEDIMQAAVGVADEIFGQRESFPKTENTSPCRNCFFSGLCGRET